MLNLSILLEETARTLPERTAVILGETQLTYAQIQAMSSQVAHALTSRGIEPGDKVALLCPNLPYFPILYFGILKAGAVVVPLNVLLKRREIAYHLKDSDAKAFFCFQGNDALPTGTEGWGAFGDVETCEHFAMITVDPQAPSPIEGSETLGQWLHTNPTHYETVQRHPDDTAVILYTSGTTGQPKGAELTHANMLLNARLADTMYPHHPHDTHLLVLPLFHSFGQSVQMNAGFYRGATLVMLPRFEPEAALAMMQKHNVTFFAGVPTMYWALLHVEGAESKFDLAKIAANMRIAVSGGAALPVEILQQFKAKFKVDILEGYGLSETSPVATFNRTDRVCKPGSVGLPVWGVDVKIVDGKGDALPVGERGEVAIRGHNVMKGYYRRPEATAESIRQGWLHTGDVGYIDEDGDLFLVDRVKDMIIRGGFNVYPRELEETLLTHPAISLAAVIGVPHASHGEEVKAFVILKEGAQATPEELIAWCKDNMASYKYPRLFEIRQTLPMTATGKILKRELK